MSKPVVYCDMDGVLVDFVGAALRLHRATDLYTKYPGALGTFDIEKVLGITQDQFWAPINEETTFWEDLQPTAEAEWIVETLERIYGRENVCILTAPALGDTCFIGKRLWLRRHFPQFITRLAYAKDKSKFASPRHTLLDDADKNVAPFIKAGGQAVLVPRLWNAMYTYVKDVKPWVEGGLETAWIQASTQCPK